MLRLQPAQTLHNAEMTARDTSEYQFVDGLLGISLAGGANR